MAPVRDFLLKGAVGAACTAVLTLVGTVIEDHSTNAVQDQQLREIHEREAANSETLKQLNENVQQLDIDVVRLNDRLSPTPNVALQPNTK